MKNFVLSLLAAYVAAHSSSKPHVHPTTLYGPDPRDVSQYRYKGTYDAATAMKSAYGVDYHSYGVGTKYYDGTHSHGAPSKPITAVTVTPGYEDKGPAPYPVTSYNPAQGPVSGSHYHNLEQYKKVDQTKVPESYGVSAYHPVPG